MSFARNFPFGRERRLNAQFRVEFQNIFNRVFFAPPKAPFGGTGVGPVTTALSSSNGVYTGGYGTIQHDESAWGPWGLTAVRPSHSSGYFLNCGPNRHMRSGPSSYGHPRLRRTPRCLA